MADPEAFYLPTDDPACFDSTELTRGPWSELHQHGGPPSALLGDAIERVGADADVWHVARLTVELRRPIPIARLRVAVEATRLGRRVQWWQATLHTQDGQVVAAATATRILRASVQLPEPTHPLPPPLRPVEACEPLVFPFFRTRLGYHSAVEVRLAAGQWGKGPAAGWLRPRVPLVEGEPLSPLAAVVITADAANGIAYVLDSRRFAFVNPDLTVVLARPHAGTWVGLDARASVHEMGTGLCEAVVHDEHGACGRSALTLVVSSA